jgi:damage-control phosphatase, subfamily I
LKSNLECYPCYFRQALQAVRFSTDDVNLHWKAMRAVADFLSRLPADSNSMETAEQFHNLVKEMLGDPDPYIKVKEEFTKKAEEMEPLIGEIAASDGDPLATAVKLAIAGNIIDFGAGGVFDVVSAIRGALDFPFAVNHFEAFERELEKARTVLYLGDNTGEIYFDKPLLRLLSGKEVTFVARGGPVLNDATIEYAKRAGLDELATLTDSGITVAGFPVERVRKEVRELFGAADVVIAKGQANFESLHDNERPNIFFLLKIKCEVVARMLEGTKYGDIVIMQSRRLPIREGF